MDICDPAWLPGCLAVCPAGWLADNHAGRQANMRCMPGACWLASIPLESLNAGRQACSPGAATLVQQSLPNNPGAAVQNFRDIQGASNGYPRGNPREAQGKPKGTSKWNPRAASWLPACLPGWLAGWLTNTQASRQTCDACLVLAGWLEYPSKPKRRQTGRQAVLVQQPWSSSHGQTALAQQSWRSSPGSAIQGKILRTSKGNPRENLKEIQGKLQGEPKGNPRLGTSSATSTSTPPHPTTPGARHEVPVMTHP